MFARAAQSLPDLSRGTVYATLAEFTEAGLLAAIGTPEPVRYETNSDNHAHFRCRACLRIHDVDAPPPDPEPFEGQHHRVERIDLRAEGICKQCIDYDGGLRTGSRAITRSGASATVLAQLDAAATEIDSPLGPLLIAATPRGVARVAFADHGDAKSLRALARRRPCRGANAHLRDAADQLSHYFQTEPLTPTCAIDWDTIDNAEALEAPMEIPYGARRSYHTLALDLPARGLGRALGANPIAILSPCHRVSLGVEMPDNYVGGSERRSWLLAHERQRSHGSTA